MDDLAEFWDSHDPEEFEGREKETLFQAMFLSA
jgi:hypothetical protein